MRQLQKFNIDRLLLKSFPFEIYTLTVLVRTAKAANHKGFGIKRVAGKRTNISAAGPGEEGACRRKGHS